MRLKGKALARRDAQVKKWILEGVPKYRITEMAKEKFGSGPHYTTIQAMAEELENLPIKRKTKTKKAAALTLSSPTGLVPAREVSNRLQSSIIHLADAMAKEGVLKITIDGRQVSITHTPEETMIEV